MLNRNVHRRSKRTVQVPSNIATPRRFRHGSALSQRTRGSDRNQKTAFAPPENWYEPADATDNKQASYRIVIQPPGPGYRHVLTSEEIRNRLAMFPASALETLQVVQLSRMTRKKQSFPCYGMQWGSTLYLYPIEIGLIEYYTQPPKPVQLNEAKMYGGRWINRGNDEWTLVWTEAAIKDFYLNNILIHELGHLLDNRNSTVTDRERFAEWFAVEHGYKRSNRLSVPTKRAQSRTTRRRHHSG